MLVCSGAVVELHGVCGSTLLEVLEKGVSEEDLDTLAKLATSSGNELLTSIVADQEKTEHTKHSRYEQAEIRAVPFIYKLTDG